MSRLFSFSSRASQRFARQTVGKQRKQRFPAGSCMGGTGLEPVTPELVDRVRALVASSHAASNQANRGSGMSGASGREPTEAMLSFRDLSNTWAIWRGRRFSRPSALGSRSSVNLPERFCTPGKRPLPATTGETVAGWLPRQRLAGEDVLNRGLSSRESLLTVVPETSPPVSLCSDRFRTRTGRRRRVQRRARVPRRATDGQSQEH